MFKLALASALAFAVSSDSEVCLLEGCEPEGDEALSLLQHKAEQKKVEREDPDGGEEKASHWNYVDPAEWAQSYPDCAGNAQSPINLDVVATQGTMGPGRLEVMYQATDPKNLKVMNNGHSIQVNGQFGSIRLPDGLYNVLQFHFHCPSEHAVAGKLLPCEMHIVHQKEGSSGTDDLAVIGILLDKWSHRGNWADASTQLNFLRRVGFGQGRLPKEGVDIKLAGEDPIDLGVIFAQELAGHYWHYRGSLTTPPCSETVHWYMLQNSGAITPKMITEFKALFPDPANNRPVQEKNTRTILSDVQSVDSTEFQGR